MSERREIPIVLNGSPRRIPEATTVAELLRRLELSEDRVAVEWNLRVLPRAEFSGKVLQPEDRIEIVTFVGGG